MSSNFDLIRSARYYLQPHYFCLPSPGMTNAGKTYTIAGPDDEPGLLPRTLAEVFRRLAAARPAVSDGVAVLPAMTVLVSYLEVYNEQVYDLLAAFAPGGAVATRAGAGGATFVREPLEIKDGRWVLLRCRGG